MSKPFTISCRAGTDDAKLFTDIVNLGIDANLEAFTKSTFTLKPEHLGSRLHLDFDLTEMPILLRRLRAVDSEEARQWADDIEEALRCRPT